MKIRISETEKGKRKNIVSFFAVLVLIVAVTFVVTVSAVEGPRTIYVDDDRVDYPAAGFFSANGFWDAVNYANNASNNVSTIIVYPGIYTPPCTNCFPMHLSITRPMTIQGIGYPVIDGMGFLQNAATGSRCCGYSLIQIWAPNVTIQGFEFRNIARFVMVSGRAPRGGR